MQIIFITVLVAQYDKEVLFKNNTYSLFLPPPPSRLLPFLPCCGTPRHNLHSCSSPQIIFITVLVAQYDKEVLLFKNNTYSLFLAPFQATAFSAMLWNSKTQPPFLLFASTASAWSLFSTWLWASSPLVSPCAWPSTVSPPVKRMGPSDSVFLETLATTLTPNSSFRGCTKLTPLSNNSYFSAIFLIF